ncbi:YbjN domain-containing protein [Phenylobacterium sp.]|uniref:YbjN domain-containing protein n=1 Tax=Phenylobacterium sp. TaxID=1871053 RepID=UPI002736DDE0|nr:YbjN domain-containing protein [Phenylobacterium sp.]MDP3855589.1 YbjN domain-containing protein [Phenylobacterium sp.]
MRSGVFLAVALSVSVACGAVEAKTISKAGLTPAEAAAWLKREGFETKVVKAESGGFYIDSTYDNGGRFQFFLLDCKQERCLSGQFFTVYTPEVKLTLEAANTWNTSNRFVKAHVFSDDGPMVTYDVTLAPGATYASLTDSLEIWLEAAERFDKLLGEPEPTPSPRP